MPNMLLINSNNNEVNLRIIGISRHLADYVVELIESLS